MIVLFTGAGGTGKTTMAKSLSEAFNVPFLASSSREVQKEFGITCEDDQKALSPEDLTRLQKRITERYWADACTTAAMGEGYISDRTIADHFVYRVMKGWSEIDEAELLQYEERIMEQFTSADLVVHCPTGMFEPEVDGFRTNDLVQRDIFDYLIRGVIDRIRGHINIMSMTVEGHETRARHLRSTLLNVGAIEPDGDEEARLIRH